MYLPKKKIQGEEEEPAGESTIPVWVTGTTTGIYLTSRRRRGRKKEKNRRRPFGQKYRKFSFSFFFSSSAAQLSSDGLFFLTAFAFVQSL
jgi:hypothetical protein